MPPHCDSLDGPVVRAAHMALVHGNVDLALPYVPVSSEAEVREAFDRAMHVREIDPVARDLGERHFYETVVRLHRKGEGAPYTGLKPMGLDVGPAIPLAEEALDTANPEPLLRLLHKEIDEAVVHRLAEVIQLARSKNAGVTEARRFVNAMLSFQTWSHHVHEAVTALREVASRAA